MHGIVNIFGQRVMDLKVVQLMLIQTSIILPQQMFLRIVIEATLISRKEERTMYAAAKTKLAA